MKTIQLHIEYNILQLNELSTEVMELFKIAQEMLEKSYSPYSNFQVAATLRTSDGKVFSGCNQENASYPLCICAERVALYNAGTDNKNSIIEDLVITARNPVKKLPNPVSPCGACRQVIFEFEEKQNRSINIYLKGDDDEIYHLKSATQLLPLSFSSKVL